MEDILKRTEGVGKVRVMITFRTSAEKVVEKDLEKSESARREETVFEDTAQGAHTAVCAKGSTPSGGRSACKCSRRGMMPSCERKSRRQCRH